MTDTLKSQLDEAATESAKARKLIDRAPPPISRACAPPCVLIVEDQAEVSGMLRELVSHAGLRSHAVDRLARAVEKLSSCSIIGALVDFYFPEGTAGVLLAALQAAGIPALIVSGLEVPEAERHGYPLVIKPDIKGIKLWLGALVAEMEAK